MIGLLTKDKQLKQYFNQFVTNFGYRFTSENKEVIEGLKRQWVDVLVLDDKTIDSFSVYQEIKQFHPSCQIVLIYEKGNGLVRDIIQNGIHAWNRRFFNQCSPREMQALFLYLTKISEGGNGKK